MPTIKELYEKRASVWEKQKEVLDRADEEGRDYTEDEEKQFDEYEKEFTELNKNIRLKEKKEEREKEMAEAAYAKGQNPENYVEDLENGKEQYRNAFHKYIKDGFNALSEDERGLLYAHKRDLNVGTDAEGGYTVPEGFQQELDIALKQFGGMRQAARILPTATGNDMPFPSSNDTSQEGEIINENTAVAQQDVSFGSITLKSFIYSSKEMPVSRALLQDSAFNLDQILGQMSGERIGRITNRHFTTGDNSSKPQGVVTGATEGVAAGGDAIERGELLDLIHSVDPAYRVARSGGPHVGFMFSDRTLKVIKKLTIGSSDARPLWQPSMRQGEPDMLEGFPYIINQDMSDIGAGNKSMLFGDFSKYLIRDVMGFTLMRLNERRAEKFQVVFLGFSRHDGRIQDAGTNPIKYLTNATS